MSKPATKLSLVEDAKRRAAFQAVNEHFDPSFTHVGIGSGSTVQYVVEAIVEKTKQQTTHHRTLFVPTGYQSRSLVDGAGLTSITFESLGEKQVLDVAFDGADEVDEELNCIKGGGACLFQEKLVATKAKKFVCVADFRKDVDKLLTNWEYIPVEVAPIAVKTVMTQLRILGCSNPTIRATGQGKEGPLKTDQDFYIIKAPFPRLSARRDLKSDPATTETLSALTHAENKGKSWEPEQLATAIKAIQGVLEVGLFVGLNGPEAQAEGAQGGQKPVAVYFGMQDGSVKVRTAPSSS